MVYNCIHTKNIWLNMATTQHKKITKNPTHVLETESTMQTDQAVEIPSAASIFIKATLLALSFAFVMLLITGVGIGIWGYTKVQTLFTESGISYQEMKTLVSEGLANEPKQTNGVTTVLLLGLDSLETRPGSPQLTDTIMLIFINYADGTISTLPLPRDIWSTEFKTKINALYFYGQERYPDEPERFSREVIAELTGTSIDYTVVITMDQVSTIIDTLGGVNVDVPHAFTDTQFPRSDVDVTQVTDPNLLYQTISFKTGPQILSGEQALQYMRSRKSGDDEGDDNARGARQQLIIQSLANTAQSKAVLTNLKLIGTLLRYYQETYSQYMSLSEGISIATKLFEQPEGISFVSRSLPILPENQDGVLINPPIKKYSVWVYEIVDKTAFQNYIHSLVK